MASVGHERMDRRGSVASCRLDPLDTDLVKSILLSISLSVGKIGGR